MDTPNSTDAQAIPLKLRLDRARGLEIHWSEGQKSEYSLSFLRTMCPCATCKTLRDQSATPRKKTSLTVLPGNFSAPLAALSAELVGNYALRIEWSDQHGTGIYSFTYLREIGKE